MKKRLLSLLLTASSVLMLFGTTGCSKTVNTSSIVGSSQLTTSAEDDSDESSIESDQMLSDYSQIGSGQVSSKDSQPSVSAEKSSSTVIPADDPNNQIKVEFVKQNTDVIRQDSDGNRRLVYIKITNTKDIALNNANLYYKDKGKAVTRELGLVFVNTKVSYDTFWIDESQQGYIAATIKNGNEVVWKGSINIQPSSKNYVIPKSKCYTINDMKPMMLRGVNYFHKYECWGKDWLKDDFTKEWNADFKEMSTKLNINSVRAFALLKDELLYLGKVPTSETIIKIGKFLTCADKYQIKVLMCLESEPKVSTNQGENLRFVRGVIEPFMNDGRVIMWDLINEPDDDHHNDQPFQGMTQGGALDTMLKTLYPKLRKEFAPNQMTCIGTGYRLEKLQALGLSTQVGSWHGYIQSDLPVEKVYQGYVDAANKFWNGKRDPWMIQEWGYPSQTEGENYDDQYQLKVYQSYIPAILKLYEEGYNLIGSYAWCAYEYPNASIDVDNKTLGLIKADGTVKPAGRYLAETYADLRKKVPAPWEKK